MLLFPLPVPIYKMNPLLMVKKPQLKVRLMEPVHVITTKKINVKKEMKKVKAIKEPKNLSTDTGTFMTEKTKKAREDRQKMLGGAGQANDDWLMNEGADDDAKQKALRSRPPQVVVSGGFDPKVSGPASAKKKRGADDDE